MKTKSKQTQVHQRCRADGTDTNNNINNNMIQNKNGKSTIRVDMTGERELP